MQSLRLLSRHPEAAWYRLEGDFQGRVERHAVSTPDSRAICNRPELLGVEYTDALGRAMAGALRHAPFADWLRSSPEHRLCVVNFLRGGLNFELRRALHAAYGVNRHSSAFMSSQRRRVEGRWVVEEDMYRKLDIPREAILVMGDVVATGVTLENGLQVVVEHVSRIGSSLRGIVFFTIGCHKAEKVLERVDALCRERFPGYERTVLVYLEAKFHLVDSHTRLRIGIPGTDLVRLGALLTPDFALSQYDDPAYPLERCAIYDAGSRAYDICNYAADVLEYWEQVERFAVRGWTLAEALEERWPVEHGAADWPERAARLWPGTEPGLVEAIARAHRELWEGERGQQLRTAGALRELARRRVDALRRAGPGVET